MTYLVVGRIRTEVDIGLRITEVLAPVEIVAAKIVVLL
jgi:hypothetical protein